MRNLGKLAAAALLLGASAPASAAVTICLGGGCAAQPGSNVLLNTGDTGTSVQGTLNNAPGTVTLTSTESLSPARQWGSPRQCHRRDPQQSPDLHL